MSDPCSFTQGLGDEIQLGQRQPRGQAHIAGPHQHGAGFGQLGQIAEELRLAVASLAHRSRQHGERLQLRASVACAMALEEDAETLLARLNQALERAKRPLALSA